MKEKEEEEEDAVFSPSPSPHPRCAGGGSWRQTKGWDQLGVKGGVAPQVYGRCVSGSQTSEVLTR